MKLRLKKYQKIKMTKLVLQAPVYKYFEFISMNDKQSCLYNCLLCVALKKKNSECRSMKSTTSNLRGHLSKHHPSATTSIQSS